MFTCHPIGYVRCSFSTKHHLPKQALIADQRPGRACIELLPGYNFEQALLEIEGFDYLWIVFWMHEAKSYKPKVQPPGCDRKIGVFATRSPHRPNPIGISRVKLLGVKGRVLEIEGCDMLDATPVLDIKPYISSVDSCLQPVRLGWIDEREEKLQSQPWSFQWTAPALKALEQLAEDPYLKKEYIERVLSFGPYPNSSNRLKIIKKNSHTLEQILELALGRWRVIVHCIPPVLTIEEIYSGYKSADAISDSRLRDIHLPWIRSPNHNEDVKC